MSKRGDKTSMGGTKEDFQTTCWTDILDAKTLDRARRRDVINDLIKRYWKPVYCYLRHRGYSNESAKDLTQGFFHEVVFNRELIQRADQTKGRFRTFLLTSLKNYTADVHDKETAGKRSPKAQVMSLKDGDMPDLLKTHSELEPDQIFHYAWATEILNQVLAEVRDNCYGAQRGKHWQVFYEKVVTPILDNAEAPPLKELCAKYGIENEAKASNMIFAVKSQFRSAMRSHLRPFVQSEADVEDEFRDILEILSGSSPR